MAKAVGKEAFVRQERAIMSRADSRPLLPQIACPTLVLCGRQDAITPPEGSRELVKRRIAGRYVPEHREDLEKSGREDLQVATTLEPQRAVLRSYLGKAFSDDYDLRHARKELDLANLGLSWPSSHQPGENTIPDMRRDTCYVPARWLSWIRTIAAGRYFRKRTDHDIEVSTRRLAICARGGCA